MKKTMLKKMKKTKIMMICAIFLLLFAATASASLRWPDLKLEILRYEPSPVEPGGYFDVWVGVANEGTKAENVMVEFVPEYPFSLAPGESEVKVIDAIPAVEEAVVQFRFFCDVDAPTGDSKITFMFKAAQRAAMKLEKDISVRAAPVSLTIDSYKLTPEVIKPGEKVVVDLTFKNHGKVGIKNVDIMLNLKDDSKFSTVTTGTKQRIKTIEPGDVETIRFDLIADTSTEVKVYQLPITLGYEDFRGNDYSDEAKISLIVGAMPELMALVDSTEIVRILSPGEVSLQIVNKGIVDLKYLKARIIETPDYDVLSPSNEAYIGNLDSDDFETVDFIIKPKVPSPLINFVVEFKDPYNNDYVREFNLPLKIVSPSELGQKKTPWSSIILGLAVIAGVGYWFYRKRKKKKLTKK